MKLLFILLASSVMGYFASDGRSEGDIDMIQINWSAFSTEDFMNTSFSSFLVQKLPVVQYWDVLKGSFRSAGLIGDSVNRSINSLFLSGDSNNLIGLRGLVSTIEKKVVVRGKSRKISADLVELPMVFMHSLNAMKEVAFMHDVLRVQVQNRGTSDEISAKKTLFSNRLGPDWISPSELVFKKNLTFLEIEQLKYNYNMEKVTDAMLQAKSTLKLNKSKELLILNHQKIMQQQDVHSKALFSLQEERIASLRVMYAEEESRYLTDQIKLLESEIQLDIKLLQESANITQDAMSFRQEEEGKLNREKELLELKLLTTKGALALESTERLIQSFCAELLRLWREASNSDQWVVVAWVRALLLTVVAAVGVYELISAMKILVLRGLAGEGGLSLSFIDPARIPAEKKGEVLDEGGNFMTWQSPARPLCLRMVNWIRQAKDSRRLMPNLLFVGPAGCGKSHLARLVATQAGASHLVVCAGDLLALGVGAGPYLRRLLDGCSQRRMAAVVVVDEADGIVARRKQADQAGIIVVNPCLYAILEATRNSSPNYSLLLTTRLVVADIDPALLDRMDQVVVLQPPSLLERMELAMRLLQHRLLNEVDNADDRTSLQTALRFLDDVVNKDNRNDSSPGLQLSDLYSEFYSLGNLLPVMQLMQSCHQPVHRSQEVNPEIDRPALQVQQADAGVLQALEYMQCSLQASEDFVLSNNSHLMDCHSECSGSVRSYSTRNSTRNRVTEATALQSATAFSRDSFSHELCIGLLVRLSGDWSFRDIQKFFKNVKSSVMSSERFAS